MASPSGRSNANPTDGTTGTRHTERRLRLVFVLTRGGIGGAERQLTYMLRVLSTMATCHLIVGETNEQAGGTAEMRRILEPFDVSVTSYRMSAVSLARVLREIRLSDSDLVQVYGLRPFGLALAARALGARCQIVFALRGSIRHWTPSQRGFVRLVGSGIALIISNSGRCATEWRQIFDRQRWPIEVVPNGVEPPLGAMTKAEARQALDLPVDAEVALCVGGLRPVKRYEDAIRAIARLAVDRPDLVLCFVGDGPEKERLAAEARRLGVEQRVRFAGHRENAAALLRAGDVLLSTSESEGMSNAIMEAMLMRVPVVATAVGGTTEIIQHGDNGLLVPVSDPAALASAISLTLMDAAARERRIETAHHRMAQGFSIERMALDTLELYRGVVRASRPVPSRPRVA